MIAQRQFGRLCSEVGPIPGFAAGILLRSRRAPIVVRLMCFVAGNRECHRPVVLAQHVTKWYGPRRAVTDVSFAIEPGEIVGLLGPNGSGKSTIFRMLTGYLVPTSGGIEVAGYDVVTDSLAVRRAISYVPEDAPLYDYMRLSNSCTSWPASRDCAALRREVRWTMPPSGST